MKNTPVTNLNENFDKTFNVVGENEHRTGRSSIQATPDFFGAGLELYVQNKGFGSTNPKSVRTVIDNETVSELAQYLLQYLERAERVAAIKNAKLNEKRECFIAPLIKAGFTDEQVEIAFQAYLSTAS